MRGYAAGVTKMGVLQTKRERKEVSYRDAANITENIILHKLLKKGIFAKLLLLDMRNEDHLWNRHFPSRKSVPSLLDRIDKQACTY